jgi:hypothetical protein
MNYLLRLYWLFSTDRLLTHFIVNIFNDPPI